MSATNSKWYFTKKQVSKHFGDSIQEIIQRRASASFIQEIGIKLKLPQLTIATAITYFQRFFIRHQLKDHDRYIISTTCLFLACKVEEAHRKLHDVIKISYMVKNKLPNEVFDMEKNEAENIRNKILESEHLILTTIAFDLAVEHPYKYLLEYIKVIGGSKNLCQVAWNFVNDSLRTTLCLHYPPEYISYAAVYLATKYLNYSLTTPEKKPWWELVNVKLEILEDISKQILDLYETTGAPPPTNLNNNNSSNNSSNNNILETKGEKVETTDTSITTNGNGNGNGIVEIKVDPPKPSTLQGLDVKSENSPSKKTPSTNNNLSEHRFAPYNKSHSPSTKPLNNNNTDV